MDRPPTYNKESHPIIKHNNNCTACELGVNRERHNQENTDNMTTSVGGAGPDDLTKIKLILVGDYNGHYECNKNHQYPQVDISELRPERNRQGLLQPLNSGAFIRMALRLMYGLDTYNDCWITNAVKCNPEKVTVKEVQHLKPCAVKWLHKEMQILDETLAAEVPVLIAGNIAFKAMRLLYPDCTDLKGSLNSCRRRSDIRLGNRPVVFTENPAKFARAQPRIESTLKYNKGNWIVGKNEWLYPVIQGSPVASAIKDLTYLKEFIPR